MSGCSLPGSSSTTAPNRACVDKVISFFKTGISNGVYACAYPELKAQWFDRNANTPGKSWKSDNDLTVWYKTVLDEAGVSNTQVEEFQGDPLYIYDAKGTQIGYEYHIKVWYILKDGTVESTPTGFLVDIDLNGNITLLQ